MNFSNLEGISSFAIVGATGLVGRECLSILEEYKIKIPKLRLLASESSRGEILEFWGEKLRVETLAENSFDGIEAAFFSIPKEVTRKFVPVAVKQGCLVVDDSNCFRMQPDVPLVVPEVNGSVLRDFQGGLIATPNCTTTPLAMALKPLADEFGIERVVVSTYQSVSGAGRRASEELSKQCASLLNGTGAEVEVFPHQIAFNCLPSIGKALESGYFDEEEKIVNELRKILGVADLRVTATAVRVPTFCGHGLSANIELKKDFETVERVREILDAFSGLKVLDKPDRYIYPTNLECIGSNETFVGRIRRDFSVPHGINLWVMADNLRKGAALNALECLSTVYGYRRMN